MTPQDDILSSAHNRSSAIRNADIDIYKQLIPDQPSLFYPDSELEALVAQQLVGEKLRGPIRTRSKLAKELVSKAMGYDPPSSFRRTQPRFPGQDLDVYVQTTDNLQIWNQEVSPERRYVLVRPNRSGLVKAVRVVRGQQVVQWDSTGTLTAKFQAKRMSIHRGSKLVSPIDTENFRRILSPVEVPSDVLALQRSGQAPSSGNVLPIARLYERLLKLIDQQLEGVGAEQDRMRGELLQEAVCKSLGLRGHENHGQWPDIVSQALEVKLQTSPTIDLGLVFPTDEGPALALSPELRHCDARYLIAYGDLDDAGVTTITAVVVTTGADFSSEFTQFGGLVQNTKRQIRLPLGLFES